MKENNEMIEDSRLIKLYNGFLQEELLTTRVLKRIWFQFKANR